MNCEEKLIMVDDRYPMANCGYSNPTPWDTPREVDEEVLEQHLEKAVQGIEDFESAIFNFHVPPYDCTLDDCPKLDWSTDPPTPVVTGGVAQSAPAGSTAVRKVIEKYQPLLQLCGHIHESRGLVKSRPHDRDQSRQRIRGGRPAGVHLHAGAGQGDRLSDDVWVTAGSGTRSRRVRTRN